jgi:hypothetical protein
MSQLLPIFFLALVPAASAAIAQEPPPIVSIPARAQDPARMAWANSVAAKLMPPGAYRRMIDDPFNLAMGGLGHGIVMKPVTDFAREVGVQLPAARTDYGPTALKHRLLEILDPASWQRTQVTSPALRRLVGELADQAEPGMRNALAYAYAERLDAGQLRDLDRFLGTRSGAAYASVALSLQHHPAVVLATQSFEMSVIKAMPRILSELDAAAAKLPKPKTAADLTDAEREKIAAILNVAPATLRPAASAAPK